MYAQSYFYEYLNILRTLDFISDNKQAKMEIVKCDLPCDRQGEHVKLSKAEVDILEYRFEFKVKTLCQDHYKDQFSRYPGWHKKCVDPCSRHSKPAKSKLTSVFALSHSKNIS